MFCQLDLEMVDQEQIAGYTGYVLTRWQEAFYPGFSIPDHEQDLAAAALSLAIICRWSPKKSNAFIIHAGLMFSVLDLLMEQNMESKREMLHLRGASYYHD